jgi:hypothetical protein
VGALVGALGREGITGANVTWLLLLIALCLVVNIWIYRSQVVFDKVGLAVTGLTRTVRARWEEIEDVHQSPHFLRLSVVRMGKPIKLVRGEYGLSLEPFEALLQAIKEHVSIRLHVIWDRLTLPVSYRYPGVLASDVLAYGVPVGLAALFFIFLLLGQKESWLGRYYFSHWLSGFWFPLS